MGSGKFLESLGALYTTPCLVSVDKRSGVMAAVLVQKEKSTEKESTVTKQLPTTVQLDCEAVRPNGRKCNCVVSVTITPQKVQVPSNSPLLPSTYSFHVVKLLDYNGNGSWHRHVLISRNHCCILYHLGRTE